MLFNSYIFILFFLPLALFFYFFLNHIKKEKAAKLILIAMSLWFYAYFHISYLALILISVFANYGISKALLKMESLVCRRAVLTAGIMGNIGVIVYFKYLNFMLENMNYFLHTSFPMKNILMPLGISFFTFQQISYLVDSYRRETDSYGLVDYVMFVTFFPQLVAGPIVTHGEIIPQFQDPARKRFNQENLARGLYLFSTGLAKKVLIADIMGQAVEWGFANPHELSAIGTFILSLLYTFQLYFDFSGYCDMAGGIACMFCIELPVNFNSPYKAVSIADFWKRWHISLTRFLTKYVYFPMGGNRKGKQRTYLNIMAVYLTSGIWHGANWTFILWGGIHGIMQIIHKINNRRWERLPQIFRWLGTFLFIDLSWLIFRANSLNDCVILFRNMLTGKSGGIAPEISRCFDIVEFTYVEDHVGILGSIAERIPHIHMWIFLAVCFLIALLCKNCYEKKFRKTTANALGCVVLLVWSIMSLSGLSVFLYFNF